MFDQFAMQQMTINMSRNVERIMRHLGLNPRQANEGHVVEINPPMTVEEKDGIEEDAVEEAGDSKQEDEVEEAGESQAEVEEVDEASDSAGANEQKGDNAEEEYSQEEESDDPESEKFPVDCTCKARYTDGIFYRATVKAINYDEEGERVKSYSVRWWGDNETAKLTADDLEEMSAKELYDAELSKTDKLRKRHKDVLATSNTARGLNRRYYQKAVDEEYYGPAMELLAKYRRKVRRLIKKKKAKRREKREKTTVDEVENVDETSTIALKPLRRQHQENFGETSLSDEPKNL